MSGVTIVLDRATPLLERMKTVAQAEGLALVGARAVGGLVKEHLYGLDQQRHGFGRHFYRQAGDSVTTGLSPRGAYVAITQTGFRQRLLGGTIRPKVTKMLTIPADPEAVGMRAGEFNDLEVGRAFDPKTGAIRLALIRRPHTRIRYRRVRGEGGAVQVRVKPVAELGGEPMFWLVKKVTQRADPTVLPHGEQMNARAAGAMEQRIVRLVQRSNAGNQEGES
jgi:hypothetical protein